MDCSQGATLAAILHIGNNVCRFQAGRLAAFRSTANPPDVNAMKTSLDQTPQRWDIFCRVIDNYGDIGVCWRLARQLRREYNLSVRLWLDDIKALRRLWPSATEESHQVVSGIEVILWTPEATTTEIADVVIEAFACDLPPNYIDAMAARNPRPVWLNLEYLSAESWVDDCHGMRSIHPQNGLTKTFFFPGFTERTGGLLCEARLREQRAAFQQSADLRSQFLAALGVVEQPDALLISLFSYENSAIYSLLDNWRNSPQAVHCLVPEGKILPLICQHLGITLAPGDVIRRDQLTLQVIPFLSQDQYDRLLWGCHLNFVRGEDSFVRAQWAARPLVWHIYPQEDDAHLAKLEAFLQRYRADMSPELGEAVEALWGAWNRGFNCQHPWNQCLERLSEWQRYSQNWEQDLNSLGDLAAKLVQFCKKPL